MKEKYEQYKTYINFISFLIFWGIFYLICPELDSSKEAVKATQEASRQTEGIFTLVLALIASVWFTPIIVSAAESFHMFFSSPIFRKRWNKFKSLKRGYYSFILIVALFVISFFAEFLINGNAIFVRYKGKTKFTLFSYARAKDFGMKGYGMPNYRAMKLFYTERNEARAKRIKENKLTEEDKEYVTNNYGDDYVIMPIYPYGPIESLLDEIPCRPPQPPTWNTTNWRDSFFEEALYSFPKNKPTADELVSVYGFTRSEAEKMASYDEPVLNRMLSLAGKLKVKEEVLQKYAKLDSNFKYNEATALQTEAIIKETMGFHILGTDDRGRDVFARMVYGFRISLAFALITNILSYAIGISFGALLGYYGGKFDIIMQRFIEIWSAMPFLYTVMIFASIMVPNFWMLVGILVLFDWMGMTYYIRGEFLREKSKDYVAAAKAIGCTDSTIIFKHILPNSLTPVISFAPFAVIAGISSLVSLDFLGFGLPAPTPSWGELLGQGLGNLAKPWLILSPTIAMFLTLLLVSFIGEAIREAFDPKQYSRLR